MTGPPSPACGCSLTRLCREHWAQRLKAIADRLNYMGGQRAPATDKAAGS